MVLDAESIDVIAIEIDGRPLPQSGFEIDQNQLTIFDTPDQFTLKIHNTVNPSENTQLSGLYRSGAMLCTQCEAEGFRRITPAIDRPDNLAIYRVTLCADANRFPVLLSNGNLVDTSIEDGLLTAIWEDPFPKPTYLFAIVAGQLSVMKDTFTTVSGRNVDLHFYAYDRDIDKCEYAVGALKRSMAWDESAFGREYDLDLYNVVAVGDFNMGAMENKSLNIFNTKYVLADADIATDKDFQNVERVIGHEYFHNWSGNRVTCRDWFQLSLKEGFTVFRDQEFGAAMGSRGVCRIEDVDVLRNRQFPEDASSMAHPIRPDAYREINNFYTVTIYEKGAEVVRMLQTIVGEEAFRRGSDLYFQRHDGQAVTTDDFVSAIEDAASVDDGIDLSGFRNWYSQAGTPIVTVESHFDETDRTYTLILSQRCDPTPGQDSKQPFLIPIRFALLDQQGNPLPLNNGSDEDLILLRHRQQKVTISNIHREPVPSLLRGFSSPIKLETGLNFDQLCVIFKFDSDPFNRWEAGQQLFQRCILDNIEHIRHGRPDEFDHRVIEVIGDILHGEDNDRDWAFIAKLLTLPGETWLAELCKPVNPEHIFLSRSALKQEIAKTYKSELITLYGWLQAQNDGKLSAEKIALRSMRDVCLSYLGCLDSADIHDLSIDQLATATSLTDRISALSAITNSTCPDREQVLNAFFENWRRQDLVVDKWFRLQATSTRHDTLQQTWRLCEHPAFDYTNPNKVYSLIAAFCHSNPRHFHSRDGKGYRFLTHWVAKLDPVNPQVAARLTSAFNGWRNLIPELGEQIRQELEKILLIDNLSGDVSEIVSKALA